jgi:hypothetical protein
MSEYLMKVEKLRNLLNESNGNFEKVLVKYPTISKKSSVAIQNILGVSSRYISALSNFLEAKGEEKQISEDEKAKIKGILDYYKGMQKILSNYDVS